MRGYNRKLNMLMNHDVFIILMLLAIYTCCALGHANETGGDDVHGDVVKYKWEVDYVIWSPDCVEKLVIGINGVFPGPSIRGRVGDTLEVHLHNLLPTESLSIHWHGIHQIDTPWADGVAFVTQCAINSGETFVYRFKLDKAGTYSYYGFNGLQRSAGLYGMLIVDRHEKDPFKYDGEFSLLLSDWWHKSAEEQSFRLLAPLPQFRWVGEPQSLLMNGRGRYDCALVPKGGLANSGDVRTCNASNPQCAGPLVMPVERSRTYRIRIASVTSTSSLNFLIEKHKLTVVEADGNFVEPFEVDDLDIYAGQSYSVLVSSNQFPGRNYWVAVNVRGRPPQTPPHLAVLNYFPVPSSIRPPFQPPKGPLWNDTAHSKAQSKLYKARKGYEGVPSAAQKQIILLNTQNFVKGRIKWALNNISLALPSTPFLQSMLYGLNDAYDQQPPPTSYAPTYDISSPPRNANATSASKLYQLPFWHTIDIVLQNANTLFPKSSEIHPWHLHGHDFWVIGQGNGKFDPEQDPKSYNLVNPPLRNTVVLFPYGWVTLRFKADNIGVWLFHCNIEPHLLMGMAVVLEAGVEWMLDEPPKSTSGCGLTKSLISGFILEK